MLEPTDASIFTIRDHYLTRGLDPFSQSSGLINATVRANRNLYILRIAKAEYFLKSFLCTWTVDSYETVSDGFDGKSIVSCSINGNILLQTHLRYCVWCEGNPDFLAPTELERKMFTFTSNLHARERRESLFLNLFLGHDESFFTLFALGGKKDLKKGIGRPFKKKDHLGPLTPSLLYLRAVEFVVNKLRTSWNQVFDQLEEVLAKEVNLFKMLCYTAEWYARFHTMLPLSSSILSFFPIFGSSKAGSRKLQKPSLNGIRTTRNFSMSRETSYPLRLMLNDPFQSTT